MIWPTDPDVEHVTSLPVT